MTVTDHYPVVFFDLDGTLTDPGEGIINSIMYALDKMGLAAADRRKLESFIGPPLVDSFKGEYGLSNEAAWQGVLYYREYFAERGMFENQIYPGIPELLMALKGAGKRIGLATSKPTVYAAEIVAHFKLTQFFDGIFGSELDGSRTAKGEVIAEAMRRMSPIVTPDQAIMIGDRKYDVIGARENGLDAIAVAYGYGTLEELREAAPIRIAPTVGDLQALLLEATS